MARRRPHSLDESAPSPATMMTRAFAPGAGGFRTALSPDTAVGARAMGDALVVIEITLVNGGIDNAAELVWVSDAGDEQKYTDIVARATVKQETFAGHRWMVRGLRSRQVLLRIEAQPHPALQQFQIDVDAEPPSADDDDAAAATEEDAQMDAVDTEANPAEEGAWIGGEGLCQFVRVPPRRGGPVVWRELDVDGNEAGRLTQLDARVDTRWLWWASSLYKRTMSMSADKEVRMLAPAPFGRARA